MASIMKKGDKFQMVDGRKADAVAFAKFDEAIHETGMCVDRIRI